jgi:lysophospholipase L1-like esterase
MGFDVRNIAVLLAWCAMLALMAGCERKEAPAAGGEVVKPAGVSKYLALGDSYTIGQSVAPQERYPVLLADALRKDGVDVGEPTIIARTGWTTRNLLDAMDRADLKGSYELVTVLIGVNNQFQGRGIEEYRTELKEVLEKGVKLAGGKREHVVAVSIPDWGATPMGRGSGPEVIGKQIDLFNEVKAQECKKLGISLVDVTGISRRAVVEPDLIAGDGLHPSGKMYGLWVEVLVGEGKRAVGGK